MAKDPAVLFYIDNWLVSTKEMKADERGWYLNLILHQFDKKDLPNDIEELANLCDVRFSEFESFKQKWEQVLKHKFKQNESGRLENSFAKEILKKREKFVEKRSKSGIIGYVVKYAKNELHFNDSQIGIIKTYLNFDEIDIKDKQTLKQVLEQTVKLYINGNGDENIDEDINKGEIVKRGKEPDEEVPKSGNLPKKRCPEEQREGNKSPTRENVRKYFNYLNASENEADLFFAHYEGKDWEVESQGGRIRSIKADRQWKLKAEEWIKRNLIKKAEKAEDGTGNDPYQRPATAEDLSRIVSKWD